MQQQRFGQLDCVVAGGTDREGGGDGPLVMLMHGFGAPGTDLVGLYRVLDVPSEVRFVFPAAPHMLPGGFGGRMWWPLDMAKIEAAMVSGGPRDLREEHPPGLPPARELLIEALDAAQEALGATGEQTILGGFSQGSMLACDVTLQTDRALAGLVILSGAYLNADVWTPLMPKRAGLPIFQSHGQLDPLLGFDHARLLHEAWKDAGAKARFVPFRGQHEIPMPVLDAFGKFVRETVG